MLGVHAFDVLGDPVRRRILELLADGELTLRRGLRRHPARVRHLPAGRVAAPARAARGGLRDRPARGRPPPVRGQRRAAARRRRVARPLPRGSGRRTSTRSRPSSPAAAGSSGHRREEQPDDRRRPSEINAIRRTGRHADARGRRGAHGHRSAAATTPTLDDVWDACTNPERIPRWFLPVSGDLRVGGRYQLEGNAGGTIERCDPPRSVRRDVGVRRRRELDRAAPRRPRATDRTRFELEHIAHVDDERWAQFGPGAVGVGWDGGVLRARPAPRVRRGRHARDGRRLDGIRGGHRVPARQQRGLARGQRRRGHAGGRGARRGRSHDRRLHGRHVVLMSPPSMT